MNTLVSLTSHGRRLGFLHIVLEDLVRICEPRGIRIVVSLQENEVGRVSRETNNLIVAGKVELLTVKKDYGPATKFIPCHMKYPDWHTIVVDDDVLVNEGTLDRLIAYRNEYPDAVLGFRMRKIELDGDRLRPFIGFIWSSNDKYATKLVIGGSVKEPRLVDDGFFEHVGVVSYPPNYASPSEEEWRKLIEDAPYDDDVLMQVVNIRYGFKTVILPGDCTRENLGSTNTVIGGEALYIRSGNGARTAEAMRHFADDFIGYASKAKNGL